MAYVIEAVIAAEPLLRQAVGDLRHAVVVPVVPGLALVPMTDELFDSITTGTSRPEGEAFRKLPPGFDLHLAAWSNSGPVAYVEAEFFGGVGTQTAQVWADGEVVLGPLHRTIPGQLPEETTPISQALRRLGVSTVGTSDEFDTINLGRVRGTEQWLTLVD